MALVLKDLGGSDCMMQLWSHSLSICSYKLYSVTLIYYVSDVPYFAYIWRPCPFHLAKSSYYIASLVMHLAVETTHSGPETISFPIFFNSKNQNFERLWLIRFFTQKLLKHCYIHLSESLGLSRLKRLLTALFNVTVIPIYHTGQHHVLLQVKSTYLINNQFPKDYSETLSCW